MPDTSGFRLSEGRTGAHIVERGISVPNTSTPRPSDEEGAHGGPKYQVRGPLGPQIPNEGPTRA